MRVTPSTSPLTSGVHEVNALKFHVKKSNNDKLFFQNFNKITEQKKLFYNNNKI